METAFTIKNGTLVNTFINTIKDQNLYITIAKDTKEFILHLKGNQYATSVCKEITKNLNMQETVSALQYRLSV